MTKTRVAVIGYGNIGKYAVEAVLSASDMELAGVVRRDGAANNPLPNVTFIDEKAHINTLGEVDVALLCKPTRQIKEYATRYLSQGIHTVDSFDIHGDILDLRENLHQIAEKSQATAIIAAGWDPGIDSVVRTLLESAAPVGITYTNFGPGMSMGHSVVARSKDGVKDAMSLTIPMGTGVHRRMVYVQLEYGADLETVTRAIKSDDYFKNDELHVIPVADVSALADMGHGVNMVRKARSGFTDNQIFTFDMRINNPALTAQIMVSCARACTKQKPGAYTMIEIPPVYFLDGNLEENIKRLV
ncbi:MAG: diaminopimelate dehydrogenase [Firmicutes bacterium]|nr:diaminopimelate dehydrogenase [Bacillota bacterium]